MIAATLFHWLARPHLFSWLLTAIWTVAVARLVRGEKTSLWQFPLLMLVWVNLHGGFVVGFLILLAYLAGWGLDRFLDKENPPSLDVIKRLSLASVVSLLVTLLNPAGLKVWNNVVGHVGDKTLMALQIDWHSPDFHTPNAWPFMLLVVSLIFALFVKKKSLDSGQALLCAGLAALAFYSTRNIPFFVIACFPVLGEALRDAGIFRKSEGGIFALQQELRGVTWSVLVTVIVATLLLTGKTLDTYKLGNTFNPVGFPVDAITWLEENPQSGNVYNEFTWGGYVLYRLWPETKVFIDGQTDFYGADLTQEYLTVLNAQKNWDSILDKYGVEWVLIPRSIAIADQLKLEAEWTLLYEDDIAVIMRRNAP